MRVRHLGHIDSLSGADEVLDDDGLLRLVDDPVVAILPWILMTITVGPLGFTGGMLLGFASSALLVGLAHRRGESAKMLELSDVVLFGGLVIAGLIGNRQFDGWMNNHCDEVSNATLSVLAFGSVAVGRPFTAEYTRYRLAALSTRVRGTVDRRAATAWGIGFVTATIAGWYGEWVLGLLNNIWTSWVLQTLPLVWAFLYIRWLDRRALSTLPDCHELRRPIAILIRDCAIWTAIGGIVGIIFGGTYDSSVGWAFISSGLMVAGVTSLLLGVERLRQQGTAVEPTGIPAGSEAD